MTKSNIYLPESKRMSSYIFIQEQVSGYFFQGKGM